MDKINLLTIKLELVEAQFIKHSVENAQIKGSDAVGVGRILVKLES